MQRAEGLQREATPQYAESQPHEPPTTEEIIANSGLPERAKTWLREHPDYIHDPAKNNTIIALHDTAKRQAGSEFTDAYFEKMEDLLGITPTAPQSNNGARQQPRAAPVRQQYSGPPISAPISRDSPSMSSGRPQNEPTRLTGEELQLARSLGLSPQQYAAGKERMTREKKAGLHGNG
jgi:hypothetical protein